MTRDEKEVVSALRKVLADKVGLERYTLWFGRRTRFTWDGTRLVLYVQNTFYIDWIRTVFQDAIEEACKCVLGTVPDISYELHDSAQFTESDDDLVEPELTSQSHSKRRSSVKRRPSSPKRARVTSNSASLPTWEELPLFASACQSREDRLNEASPPASSSPISALGTSHTSSQVDRASLQPSEGCGDSHSELDPRDQTTLLSSEAASVILTEETETPRGPAGLFSEGVHGLKVIGSGEEVEDTTGGTISQNSNSRCNGGGNGATSFLKSSPHQTHAPHWSEEISGGQRHFADLESFVVGDCNRLAYAAAETVSRSLGSYSPLLIHGPSGIGKTHLLEGIWKAVKRRNPRVAALYLSAEQFTSAYVEALRSEGVPAFRQKYRGVQLLLLDDLHFFAGKRQTQIELLYTLDTLLKNGCQIVCAADRPPAELRELTPELRSRLEGGIVCRIDPPDLATRRKIVEKFCQAMNFSLSSDMQEWVAESFARNVRQILGALRRLEAAFHALRRPVDRGLALEILSDMLPEGTKHVTLTDIEREVCRTFSLPEGSLQSGRKERNITYPRMLAMWLARKCTRANLSEIGRFFGKRSHATVISAQKRVEEWLSSGGRIPTGWGECSVQEALQEIERRLRAG